MKKNPSNALGVAPSGSLSEKFFSYLETMGRDAGIRPAPSGYVRSLRRLHNEQKPIDLTDALAGNKFAGKVWWWSDLHLSHKAILNFSPMRGCETVEEMNDLLLRKALEVVSLGDILVTVGDLSFATRDRTNEFLRAIPARHILVAGNHDVSQDGRFIHYDCETVPFLEFTYNGDSYFVAHYPMRESDLPAGTFNVHGHSHAASLPELFGRGDMHLGAPVELTGMKPVSIEYMKDHRRYAL